MRAEGDYKLHKCFLTAYCHSPKMAGGQQKTHRNTFVDHILKILPETPKDAPLKEWAENALSKEVLNGKINNNWWKIRKQRS